jgi:hypothetical protein
MRSASSPAINGIANLNGYGIEVEQECYTQSAPRLQKYIHVPDDPGSIYVHRLRGCEVMALGKKFNVIKDEPNPSKCLP